MTDDYIIITENLVKRFEKREKRFGFISRKGKIITAVDHVNLKVKEGEIFGILGPNGAGKTTLIKILATLILPDGGRAFVNGYDIIKEDIKVRASIGVVTGGERSVYWKLTPRENLAFFAKLYNVPESVMKKRIDYLLDIMNLKDRADDYVEDLSTGMRMKLILARALVHDPPILMLDEPTIGLDPKFSIEIRRFIKEKLNKELGKTILLTTHYMHEADYLCDRIALMNKGKIIVVDDPMALKLKIKKYDVIIFEVPLKYSNDVKEIVKGCELIENIEIENHARMSIIKALSKNGFDALDLILDKLKGKHLSHLNFRVENPTLEDVFIHYTGRGLEDVDEEEE
ncbi:MAG: ATP-binding cassette domain-containing protein [Candidatus Odinarchaeota archaeon]|nr:ATP-binding cassette domain-containing protein [Candidatus Odinarchaeota archaeon]